DFLNNPGEEIKELSETIKEKKVNIQNIDSEIKMAQNAVLDKDYEKEKILDLYRRKLINSADLERQFEKIGQEKLALEERVFELRNKLILDDDISLKFDDAEELLYNLKGKLQESPSFETKRLIARTLVKEIIVETTNPEGERPLTSVTTRYTFANSVMGTRAPADFTEMP
ncbi:MAG: recombinase family protein, partial [Peptococcaceae bacterium]|nr:recombinase family protein [Peptococcaceae bacterium]